MKRKVIFRIIICIGILCIITGGVIAFYPAMETYHSEKSSVEMLSALEQQIEVNAQVKSEPAASQSIPKKASDNVLNQKELYNGTSSKIKKILKRQNLIGIISIDKLNVRFPIAEGTNRDNIRASIGHLTRSDWVSVTNGNCVLAGHRGGIYGEFFQYIDKLKEGDEIRVTSLDGTEYVYEAYEQKVINATNWTETLKKMDGQTTLTLLSCNDNGVRRLLVRCRLISIGIYTK